MDTDDLEPRGGAEDPFAINLDDFSVEDLEARIAQLKSEIERCNAAIKARQATRESAESVFR